MNTDLNINDISTSENDEISYLKFADLMKVENDSETDRFLHSSKLPINKLSILKTMWGFFKFIRHSLWLLLLQDGNSMVSPMVTFKNF